MTPWPQTAGGGGGGGGGGVSRGRAEAAREKAAAGRWLQLRGDVAEVRSVAAGQRSEHRAALVETRRKVSLSLSIYLSIYLSNLI